METISYHPFFMEEIRVDYVVGPQYSEFAGVRDFQKRLEKAFWTAMRPVEWLYTKVALPREQVEAGYSILEYGDCRGRRLVGFLW